MVGSYFNCWVLFALCTLCTVSSAEPLRVWLDDFVFRDGETNLLQHVINGSDGAMALAGRTKVRMFQPKGHKMLHTHDLLWTGRKMCYAAFKESSIAANNIISCTPGTEGITGKASLVAALHDAFGSAAAASIMPVAFLLPSQYGEFAAYVRRTAASGVWALKEDAHRGTGVAAAPGRLALRRALETVKPKRRQPARRRFVMAQRFVDDQYLVDGRPFVMRLWAVLAGGAPVVRGYLYQGGIMVLGEQIKAQSTTTGNETVAEARDRAEALIVNLFQQNRSATVDPWRVSELQSHLRKTTGSDAAFKELWGVVERSTAAALAAAVPAVRRAVSRARMPRYQGGNMEWLGLDFVIDTSLRPWLVEVNYLPSMARKVINCVMPQPEGGERAPATGSKASTVEICRKNPMDLEKEAALAAYLKTIAARRTGLEERAAAVKTAIQGREEGCKVRADALQQVLDAEIEWAAAAEQGFSDLTPAVYRALQCLAGESAACEAVLPAPVQETAAELSFWGRAAVTAEWAVAQVRRAVLAVEFLLSGRRSAKAAAWTKQRGLEQTPTDKLVAAWLALPPSERRLGGAAAVLGKMCAVEEEIRKAAEAEKAAQQQHIEL